MKFENVSEKFGKWSRFFKNFIESEKFDEIFKTLKSRKGKVNTAPEANDLFRCFATCDPDNLKVVIVGISPYHTFTKQGKCAADGLALSCSKTRVLQPSLTMFYEDLERTYNDTIDPTMILETDLEYLSKQGVLLYNIGLTVQEGKPCSDNLLWADFNRYFFEEIINTSFRGLPILFLGIESHKSANYLLPMVHYPFLLSHPASAAHNGSNIWNSKGVWLDVDRILQQNNGTKIRWYKRAGIDDISDNELPEWVKEKVNENELSNDLPWSKK